MGGDICGAEHPHDSTPCALDPDHAGRRHRNGARDWDDDHACTMCPVGEPTDLEVLERFDLERLRARIESEGFEISPWPHPDGWLAEHLLVATAVHPGHVARLDRHRWHDRSVRLLTDRVPQDWPRVLSDTIGWLRTATGKTHADLGPTTQAEAAFWQLQHGDVPL
jgi:hypothetical protein